jgi:hypothetical protein
LYNYCIVVISWCYIFNNIQYKNSRIF